MSSKKATRFVITSFIIGNIMAWTFGAYPRNFPFKEYSEEELKIVQELNLELKKNPSDSILKTELGKIYFMHNDLDKAEDIVGDVKMELEKNSELLVVRSAIKAKQAGAMWDFSMGIMKTLQLKWALDGFDKSVEMSPENPTIRLFRLNAIVPLSNFLSSFYRVFEDEKWFLEKIENDPDFFPLQMKYSFYKVLSAAYLANSRIENDQKKETHLKKSSDYISKIDQNNISENEWGLAEDVKKIQLELKKHSY